MLVLVRALPDDVARRVVAADDKDAGVVVADNAGAPDGGGGTPHDLRVVAAHLPLRARVGVVVVVLLLAQPRPHGVRRRRSPRRCSRRTARRSAPARCRPGASPRSSAGPRSPVARTKATRARDKHASFDAIAD
jgi:hypothetical protein